MRREVIGLPAHTWPNDDDALSAELAEALGTAGAVPERMLAAAQAAFTWRRVDEELDLLVLAHDSLVEGGPAVRDAAVDGPRTLAFHGAELAVEIDLGSDVMGQLVPPQRARVSLTTAEGTLAEADADELGCFRLPLPERGPVRLVCRSDAGTAATEWLLL